MYEIEAVLADLRVGELLSGKYNLKPITTPGFGSSFTDHARYFLVTQLGDWGE